MTFRNLEERVTKEGMIEDYLRLFDKLKEPTKTVLGYTLDIASLLDQADLKEEYLLHGGYAVLTHLMSALGEKIALTWRGSTDIDIYGTNKVIQMLKGAYKVVSDLPSPNLPEKRTIKLVTNESKPEQEVRLDFSMGENTYQQAERKVFKIPLRVASISSLIKSKAPLAATADEDDEHLKQKIDVFNLLWVAEHDEVAPQEIYKGMTTEEKTALRESINFGSHLVKNKRISIAPSPTYLDTLKRELKRYK